jgi:hypothetical protein
MPAINARAPEPIVRDQLAAARAHLNTLDDALAKKDWQTIGRVIWDLRGAVSDLSGMGAAAPVMVSMQNQAAIDDMRAKLKSANRSLNSAHRDIDTHDTTSWEAALKEIRAILDQVQGPSTQPARP